MSKEGNVHGGDDTFLLALMAIGMLALLYQIGALEWLLGIVLAAIG
jgi:hypothetical protein